MLNTKQSAFINKEIKQMYESGLLVALELITESVAADEVQPALMNESAIKKICYNITVDEGYNEAHGENYNLGRHDMAREIYRLFMKK
jgi:hypothetical protein